METAPVTTATQLTDKDIKAMDAGALGRRVLELHTQFATFRAMADSANVATVQFAISMGQVFEEAFKRFSRTFGAWLKSAVGDTISEYTARKWRTLWRKRDQILTPDGSQPKCRTLTEAYIATGLLTAPDPSDNLPNGSAPIFRLTMSTSAIPLEKWSAIDLANFAQKAKPVVELYEKVMALKNGEPVEAAA